MKKNNSPLNSTAQFLMFSGESGNSKVEVRVENEMIWLTQKLLAKLFEVEIPTVNFHIKNILETRELDEKATIRKYLIVQNEGERSVSREVEHCNLDMIIAVGYRVNSKKATQFRIWATQILKEFMIKGFAMDDERLKQGKKLFDQDYFRELLERVRSIRSSERRVYQQITDIFAECSIDYDKDSEITQEFYAMIQNKFHFAITGKTAPEIIYSKADSKIPYMGLTSWKKSPTGRILQSDVVIAKNYLEEKEIKSLERTVTAFFDYIEGLITRNNLFTMKEFAESVNAFLTFNKYEVLQGKGKITKVKADKKAIREYGEYNKKQEINSDFEEFSKKLLQG